MEDIFQYLTFEEVQKALVFEVENLIKVILDLNFFSKDFFF